MQASPPAELGPASELRVKAVWEFARRWVEAALAWILLVCAGVFVVASWRWPLVGDAPLIHYVVFLIRHGFEPYRGVIDLNQPGTLAIEATVMSLLGGGALAWRVFDLLLLLIIGLAMYRLCRPPGRFAALFASVVFALIHGRDGLIQLGQRDLIIATLLMAAYALLFEVLRSKKRRFGYSLGTGLLLGVACTIKPVALALPPVLLWWYARRLRSAKLPGGGASGLCTLRLGSAAGCFA